MGIAISPQIHPQVAEFVDKPRKMLINGKWVNAASGKTFPTYNPATGEILAQVAEGDSQDIEEAVRAARKAFDHGPWRKMTASERGRLIWKLADLLEEHTEEFAYLESLDNGKPLGHRPRGRRASGGRSAPIHGGMGDQDRRQHDSHLSPLHAGSEISLPTRCASRWASSGRSFRGTSRCSWPPGNWAQHSRPVARSCSNLPSRHRSRVCAWVNWCMRGRIPRRCGQHRPRLRRDCRRGARRSSRCRQDRLHRLNRSRQANRPRCGRKLEASFSGTGRQVAERRFQRRRSRRRHPWCRQRHLLQSWPVLLRRFAICMWRSPYSIVSWKVSPKRRRKSISARDSIRNRVWVRWSPRSR